MLKYNKWIDRVLLQISLVTRSAFFFFFLQISTIAKIFSRGAGQSILLHLDPRIRQFDTNGIGPT